MGRGGPSRDDFDGPDGFGGPEGFGGGRFGGGHFGGGRHRRAKLFSGEELRLLVLALLAEEPRNGYQLIRAFADRSGEAYQPSPGVLYPLITMLADMDLVTDVAEGATTRKRQGLTPAGEAELASRRDEADALLARLAALGESAGRGAGAIPVRRAFANLKAATLGRISRATGASPAQNQAQTEDELAFRIAEILDDAARRIERL